MEILFSLAGMIGAACCVGMYGAVSIGKISADRPIFYLVNGLGAALIMLGASHSFDMGDLGSVSQELTWAVISLFGAARAAGLTPAKIKDAARRALYSARRITQARTLNA